MRGEVDAVTDTRRVLRLVLMLQTLFNVNVFARRMSSSDVLAQRMCWSDAGTVTHTLCVCGTEFDSRFPSCMHHM